MWLEAGCLDVDLQATVISLVSFADGLDGRVVEKLEIAQVQNLDCSRGIGVRQDTRNKRCRCDLRRDRSDAFGLWKDLSKEPEIDDDELSTEELLARYTLEEKLRQSDQWAVKETKSFSGMENISCYTAGNEKEQIISQLEFLHEMGEFAEFFHKERLEADKVKKSSDTRVQEIHAKFEVAESALMEAKARNQGGQEGYERQQLELKEALEKFLMQSLSESGSVEVNRAKECNELQRRSEALNLGQAERDRTLLNLRVCQEQLRLSFQRKEKNLQQEKEEIITALEASEAKSEEQGLKLREVENDLTRLKQPIANLKKRCTTADTKAGEASSLHCQLQTKLHDSTTEHFAAKNSNVQVDAMKLRLQACEKAPSKEPTQRPLAESSPRKLREEYIQEVERGNKDLEERLKWRNEQFQSLEEAHSKVRIQFTEKSSEWDAENSVLLSDIDSLQSNLDSKECVMQELQKQLQVVHHALSREESRRKVLELEAAESRQNLEQATTGYEEAQSTLETLREQFSAEVGTLRNTIGAKDMQLKDLQAKHIHMEQEYNELKDIEMEYRAWELNNGEQQRQLLSMKETMSGVVEAHDNLRSRMKELEEDFQEERRDLVKALDHAHECLSSKDEALKQLDGELDRIRGALEHAQGHRSCLAIQLKQCEEQLEGACDEASTARQALTSLNKASYAEKCLLLESLKGKDKVIQDLRAQIHNMDQTIAQLSMHEEKRLLMQRECEELLQRQIQRDADKNELESIHNSLLLRLFQEENAWLADREKLFAELQGAQETAKMFQTQLGELHYKNERHLDVIRKLETRCAVHDKEVAEHCLLADQAREELALERTEVEKERREARHLKESICATLSHTDLNVEKLKHRIGILEAGLWRKDADISSHNERVSHLERDLKETSDVLCNMEEHIAVMKSQADKTAAELKKSEDFRTNLEKDLKISQEENLAMKTDLERKLEIARKDRSALSMQLKAASQQLLEVSTQKELASKDLDLKQNILTELTEENKTLLADKDSLEQVLHVLETKKVGLLQNVESSRTTINQLCNKYEAALSNLASSCNEVQDLQAKLQNDHTASVLLLKAEEQNRDLKGYLKAAKAIAQDKEEKLAASEWAVQQLALGIGKAKAALIQKDREEALMREELADIERQLRAKEGTLIEMECYLEDALMSRESMQREVDQLRQRMEDLDRGAADWKTKEQDMTTQLEVTEAALDEKRESLVACEQEIKKGNDLREVMDGAIESLKSQLADGQRALSAQQKDMNRLCEDLERSKGEANSSSGLVKELQGRLQQLEQSSVVRINQFQCSISELKDELSLAHSQLEKYQISTRLLTEESSRYKDKCEALLDLNARKDSSLKDTEAQLFSAQASAVEQSKMLEQRDQDLQWAKEQRQYQDERQISLQESLSRIQSQRWELQLENEELRLKLRQQVQLDASSTEASFKSKEIQSLRIQLEHAKSIEAQEGEAQMLMTAVADEVESSSHVQQCEARLRAMQASLCDAQEKVQVLQAVFASKDSVSEMFLEKLSTAGKRYANTQGELSKLQEALTLAHCALSEKSEMVSVHMCAINALEIKIRSLKEKEGSSFKKESCFMQVLHAPSSRAMESEKSAWKMQETFGGIQLDLKVNRGKLLRVSLAELQRNLKEWNEKSAAAVQERLALKAASEGAGFKTLEMDMTLKCLQEALGNAEGEVCKFDLLLNTLQAELATLRVKEVVARDEGRHLAQQLKFTKEKAELNWQQVCELQEVLDKSGHELKEKIETSSCFISSFRTLQDELLELKSNFATADWEVVSLREQLKDAESKRLQCHQELLRMNEAMIKMKHDLIEERGNVQRLTVHEHDVNEEKMKIAESASLITDLQAQVEEWKRIADDAATEGDTVKQEVLLIKEAVMSTEQTLIEDRGIVQLLSRVQDDLIEETIEVAKHATLIAELQLQVEGWKTKAEDAAKGGEKLSQELQCAAITIGTLMSQTQTYQAKERAMKELNDSLQVDMNAAQEEALARKHKMESFLHELKQSQDCEKELLEYLQMEHKRLIVDLETDGGFDCKFELDSCEKFYLQNPGKTVNIRAGKFRIRDGEVRLKFPVEESQISAEDCTLAKVNEAMEKELKILRLCAEELQRQAHELVGKLDAALSNVATKNLTIKKVHAEIMGLRSIVKKLEQGTLSLQESIHGEGKQCPTDTSNLTNGRGDGQPNTGSGKRNAEIQEELNIYLELCDSLVGKNTRLEKQHDGLQRKNRGLQNEVGGLLMTEKSSPNKEWKGLDPVDCSPGLVLQGFSSITNPIVVSPAAQERRVASLQDIWKGKVLSKIDENAVPRSLERCQMSRRLPVSPADVMQQKKTKRIKDE